MTRTATMLIACTAMIQAAPVPSNTHHTLLADDLEVAPSGVVDDLMSTNHSMAAAERCTGADVPDPECYSRPTNPLGCSLTGAECPADGPHSTPSDHRCLCRG